ncbi:MAG: alpha/beta fold hydrolase [Burkholderiaceae bacterium]
MTMPDHNLLARQPYFRETGAGRGVVCIHSNASSSSQWRALMESLATGFHVLAPDTCGAGKGPAWPTEGKFGLGEEARLLEPVFARAGEPFALVGHSYGAAVALMKALREPRRVCALVLYEPTLFSLVDAAFARPNDADGIRDAVKHTVAALAVGDRDAAAQHFIDYWMGAGAWRATPDTRRAGIASAIVHAQGWADALFGEPEPLSAFAALSMPVLLLTGAQSPNSAGAVARLLASVLPRLETVSFPGVGHMGPITHPEVVNPVIQEFLLRHTA